MLKVKNKLSRVPKYYFWSKVLWNQREMSNTPNVDQIDPDNSKKKKDKTKINCRINEFNDSLHRHKSNISVAIIGSGFTAIYATLLLKQNFSIKRIHLVDTTNTLEAATFEAFQIDNSPKIRYYETKFMREALKDMDIVALLDETDFKLGKENICTQFKASVDYVRKTTEKMINYCPAALVAVFARPVTATLPLVSEIYKCAGCWDPNRIVGSVALEAMQIESFTSRLLDLNPAFFSVPLAGGADYHTIVPLLSAARPFNQFTKEQQETLRNQFQASEKELAQSESGGPTISAATAVSKFINILSAGLNGYTNAVACAYIRSNVLPFARFFTSELQFGTSGVQTNFGLPKVSQREILLIEKSLHLINEYVDIGINEAHKRRELQTTY